MQIRPLFDLNADHALLGRHGLLALLRVVVPELLLMVVVVLLIASHRGCHAVLDRRLGRVLLAHLLEHLLHTVFLLLLEALLYDAANNLHGGFPLSDLILSELRRRLKLVRLDGIEIVILSILSDSPQLALGVVHGVVGEAAAAPTLFITASGHVR